MNNAIIYIKILVTVELTLKKPSKKTNHSTTQCLLLDNSKPTDDQRKDLYVPLNSTRDNDDLDSDEEFKTSGSEYIPSNDGESSGQSSMSKK